MPSAAPKISIYIGEMPVKQIRARAASSHLGRTGQGLVPHPSA